MAELTLRLGQRPPITLRSDEPYTMARLLADLSSSDCHGCTTGEAPCPLFFHDEASFDIEGFLQARRRGASAGNAPFSETEMFTGVLPRTAESPNLRRALDEATMRLVYPYPCWGLCPTVQTLEAGLTEAELDFGRLFLARTRRSYLQSDAVSDEAVAADEALLHAALAVGDGGRHALGRLGQRWRDLLAVPALLPLVPVAPDAGPCSFVTAAGGALHAIDVNGRGGDRPADWLRRDGWRYHAITITTPDTFNMDGFLATLGG